MARRDGRLRVHRAGARRRTTSSRSCSAASRSFAERPGWDADDAALRRAAKASAAGAVIAPNFSVGMNLFYAAVADAARRYLAVGGYDPWIAEWHHRAKADAPSGTARRLAGDRRRAAAPGGAAVHRGPHGRRRQLRGRSRRGGARAGASRGVTSSGFDGPDDAVTLEHVARGREGSRAAPSSPPSGSVDVAVSTGSRRCWTT